MTASTEPTVLGRFLLVLWLTIVWTALWGSLHLGTVVAGALLGLLVVLALRRDIPAHPGRVHPVGVLRYAIVFLGMLVEATFEVVRAVINPDRVAPALIEVDLPECSPMIVTLVANSVTLTPGTITLDAVLQDDGHARLLVHALTVLDEDTVRADVLRLFELATAAFGSIRPPTEVKA